MELSSPNHWSELLYTFREKYPHFEEFKIRLPHSRNNFVKGVGVKDSVSRFYTALSELGITGQIDLASYQAINQAAITIDPIPAGYLVIWVPELESGPGYFRYGNQRETMQTGPACTLPASLSALLNEAKPQIITNQGKWVAKHLLRHGLDCQIIHDVMLNESILANGLLPLNFSNFKSLVERYQEALPEDPSLLLNLILQIWEKQQHRIDQDGLRELVDLENQTLWVIADMELRGVQVDAERLLEAMVQDDERIQALKEKLAAIFPSDLDAGKESDQVVFLNRQFGLGLPDRKDESLVAAQNSPARKVIAAILRLRALKRQRKGLERLWEYAGTGDRLGLAIRQLGTVTGRLTCQLLQTLPKQGLLRSLIVPRQGYKFVIADYAQFEARIALGLSQDRNGLAIFQADKDIYQEFAQVIMGEAPVAAGKHRKLAKDIVLGLLNGKTEYSIREDLLRAGLVLSLEDVRILMEKFNQHFAGLENWQEEVIANSFEDTFVCTAMGRRRYLGEIIHQENGARKVKNFPIQGTAADGFKRALCQLHKKFKEMGLDAHIVLTLHDEVVVETKTGTESEVKEIITACLTEAFASMLPDMPFKLETRIADSWGQ